MEITKTINEVNQGDLDISNEMTVDFIKKKIIIGVTFKNEISSCEATLEEIKVGLTGTEIAAINKFFNKARMIAINSEIQPDVDLTIEDFQDEI